MYKFPWLGAQGDDGVNYEDIEGGYSAIPYREKAEDDGRRLLQPVQEHDNGAEPNQPGAPEEEDPNLVSRETMQNVEKTEG